LIDIEYLQKSKLQIQQGNPDLRPAFDLLVAKANEALNEGPYSVTNKKKIAPSGDIHDYASYSRYWWPDPNSPNGLPYIRRDGETYPNSQNPDESDRKRIGTFSSNAETLGLAYYFTGEEKYAIKAAELLRVWFLNPETKMNPNLNHAQCRPGHNTGTKSGVLDGRTMIKAFEASLLIANSNALNDEEYKKLKGWANDYFMWLTNNEMALEEAAAPNNHGTFYDVQAIYFALYSDNQQSAVDIAQKFTRNRVDSQILPNGSMPEEVARTRPLFYSIFNLHAMFLVANLAEKVSVDIWEQDDNQSRLRAALDYLVPYTDSLNVWPTPTIGKMDRTKMFSILQMADRAYPDGNYLEEAKKLPLEKRQLKRSNLALPLMR
jgi:hypothetical protein